MDLDARPYRAFVAIAEAHSFTRAAERLNLSQPALSAQIREFERRLAFALFERTSRSVALTARGRLFLGNAQRMVVETERANVAARAIQTNQLTIGANPQSVLVPERMKLFERFMRQRPDIPLLITNDSDARHLAAVTRHEVDIAFLVEPMLGEQPAYSPLDPNAAPVVELDRMILQRRPIHLLLPKEEMAGRAPLDRPDALKGLKVVTMDRTFGIALADAVGGYLREAGVEFVRAPERNAIAVERFAAISRIAAVSLGWFGDGHLKDAEEMVSCPIDGLEAGSCLSLLRSKGDQRPGATAFWAMAEESAV